MKRTAFINYADKHDSSRLLSREQKQRNPLEVGVVIVNEIDGTECVISLISYVNGAWEVKVGNNTVYPYDAASGVG